MMQPNVAVHGCAGPVGESALAPARCDASDAMKQFEVSFVAMLTGDRLLANLTGVPMYAFSDSCPFLRNDGGRVQ